MNRCIIAIAMTLLVTRHSAAQDLSDRVADTRSPVVVVLLDGTEVNTGLATLRDVAHITGGTAQLRDEIGRLDIVELASSSHSASVTASQVKMRVLLAGYDHNDFQIRGPSRVSVRRSQPLALDSQVVSSIHDAYVRALSVDPDDILVTLTQPITVRGSSSIVPTRVEPILDQGVRLGNCRLRVGLYEDDHLASAIMVSVLVQRRLSVVTARKNLKRGDLVTESDVDESTTLASSGTSVELESIVGATLKRDIRAGQEIASRDVALVDAASEYAVRPRDQVRIVARVGKVTATISDGQALQGGRVGDSIRVVNPSSKKQLIGRVTGPNEVTVLR
ncbi:MAG: flagellar basal body P-ring formation chaperone FlgA [Pirellulaceae bacterium]|nr:flagellar basal body P-ring formation protein FlgA [Planctomycetales bacterium]MCA9263971.1 flagellar basal body P-ring formation protein FlgA [Planctomycetales bacterium]